MQEIVRDRLRKLKQNVGITYKAMAQAAGVSYSTMKSFTGGRDIKESTLKLLNDYATSMENKLQ